MLKEKYLDYVTEEMHKRVVEGERFPSLKQKWVRRVGHSFLDGGCRVFQRTTRALSNATQSATPAAVMRVGA